MVFANFFGVEPMLMVMVVALLLFGGKKIPELLRGVGRGVGELQKGLHEGKQHFEAALHDEPTPAAPITVAPTEAQPRTTSEPATSTTDSGSNI
jgi:sec-independent protein translocase protein TatA